MASLNKYFKGKILDVPNVVAISFIVVFVINSIAIDNFDGVYILLIIVFNFYYLLIHISKYVCGIVAFIFVCLCFCFCLGFLFATGFYLLFEAAVADMSMDLYWYLLFYHVVIDELK